MEQMFPRVPSACACWCRWRWSDCRTGKNMMTTEKQTGRQTLGDQLIEMFRKECLKQGVSEALSWVKPAGRVVQKLPTEEQVETIVKLVKEAHERKPMMTKRILEMDMTQEDLMVYRVLGQVSVLCGRFDFVFRNSGVDSRFFGLRRESCPELFARCTETREGIAHSWMDVRDGRLHLREARNKGKRSSWSLEQLVERLEQLRSMLLADRYDYTTTEDGTLIRRLATPVAAEGEVVGTKNVAQWEKIGEE